MKKQGNECVSIISLLKKIFVKHFKVFHKFADMAYDIMKVCECTFLCKYVCAHVHFMCVIYVCMCIYCGVFVFINDINTRFAN